MFAIGLGLGLNTPSVGNHWWLQGAVSAWDFENGRYMRNGVSISESAALSISRLSGHNDYAADVLGRYNSFAESTLRRTSAGALLESASTRLVPHPDTPFTDGTVTGATKTSEPGTFLNIFSDAARVISQGQTGHRLQLNGATLSGGTSYGVTVIYIEGTSGKATVQVTGDGGVCTYEGPTGVLAEGAVTNGSWSNVVQQKFGSVLVFTAQFTPSNPGFFTLDIGPFDVSAGSDVVAIGGWMESGQPSSPILSNPSGTSSRSADIVIETDMSWLGNDMTWVMSWANVFQNGNNRRLFELSDGTSGNSIGIHLASTGVLQAFSIVGGGFISGPAVTEAVDRLGHSAALSYDQSAGSWQLSMDGATAVEASGAALLGSGVVSQLSIGSRSTGAFHLGGNLRKLTAIPGYLSSSEVEELLS